MCEIQVELKRLGIKGFSGKTKAELERMYANTRVAKAPDAPQPPVKKIIIRKKHKTVKASNAAGATVGATAVNAIAAPNITHAAKPTGNTKVNVAVTVPIELKKKLKAPTLVNIIHQTTILLGKIESKKIKRREYNTYLHKLIIPSYYHSIDTIKYHDGTYHEWTLYVNPVIDTTHRIKKFMKGSYVSTDPKREKYPIGELEVELSIEPPQIGPDDTGIIQNITVLMKFSDNSKNYGLIPESLALDDAMYLLTSIRRKEEDKISKASDAAGGAGEAPIRTATVAPITTDIPTPNIAHVAKPTENSKVNVVTSPIRKPIIFTTPEPAPELGHPTLDRPGKAKKPTKREFEEEYAEYVRDKTRTGKEAKDLRSMIAEKATDRTAQYARLLSATHIVGVDEDHTPDPYEVFHTKRMEQLARKAAAEAVKPARYTMLLKDAMDIVEKTSARVSKVPEKDERAFEIPPSASLKVLQQLARDNGIKGFSGKSAGEIREMLSNHLKLLEDSRKSFHEQSVKAASRDAANLKFLVEAHNMDDSELERRIESLRKEHEKMSQYIADTRRQIQSDARSKKITMVEANAKIEEMNAMTKKFNEESKSIHNILRDAIHFKKTGTSKILEQIQEFHGNLDVAFN